MLKVSFLSEIILYRPSLILLFQPVMSLQKTFHAAKSPFRTPRLLGVSARSVASAVLVNRAFASRQAGSPRK